MKLMWSFLCLALFLSTCTPLVAAQGGLKMRVTKKGIDYANTVAQALIQQKLRTTRLPDFPFRAKRVKGSVSNIHIAKVNGPASSLSLNPGQNGLTWSLTRLSIDLKANWRARYKRGWIKISDHGGIEFSVSGASVTITIGIGNSNGRPTLQLKHCNANLGDVRLRFRGGRAWIYNLFKRTAARAVKRSLTPKICEEVSKVVNQNARAALARMKVTAEIEHRFLVDYGLVAPVSVTSQYLESQHKGEVTWKSDPQPSPYSPPRFPAFSDTSRMLYLWLSEYTVDTFAYAAHTHSYLQYTLTKARLPPSKATYLDTTCPSLCAGEFLPELAHKYPNSWVSLDMRSAAVPQITITPQAISISAVATVDAVVNMPNRTTANVLRLNVSLALSGSLSIANDLLKARVASHSFSINLVSSSLKDVAGLDTGLQRLIRDTLQFSIIPEINRRGQIGVDLPMSNDIRIKNAQFRLYQGFVVLSSDVDYRRV